MKRRIFLRSLLAVLGAAAAGSFIYPLLRFLAPPGGKSLAQQIILKKTEVPVGTAKSILFNNKPSFIINRPGKGFIALSRVCTHLGCLVDYEGNKNRLLCPCHAGVYDLEGNVVSGPPPKPLLKLPLKVEGENIVIG